MPLFTPALLCTDFDNHLMEWGDLPLDEHLLRQKVHISVRHQGRLGPYVRPCVGSV